MNANGGSQGVKRIAYIPARSGSKGIPRKNIRQLCGKPLMGWMIEAALETRLFDRVMVSTDTNEFAEVARSCGAWVPFLRDPVVAGDNASSIETLCSDKRRLSAIGETFDVVCMLQPTSPLCGSKNIRGAMSLYEHVGAGVVGVKRSQVRPTLLRIIGTDGRSKPLLDSATVLRRQDEADAYEVNGAIYINAWAEIAPTLRQSFNPYAYIMDDTSSIDIDTISDFKRAERLLKSIRH